MMKSSSSNLLPTLLLLLACTNAAAQALFDREPSLELSEESSSFTSSPIECTSIVALAFTADPHENSRRRAAEFEFVGMNDTNGSNNVGHGNLFAHYDEEGEMFECQLSNGWTLPIAATENQMNSLREKLNNGQLVSSVSTLPGMTVQWNANNVDTITNGNAMENAIVTLPDGPWTFTPGKTHPSNPATQRSDDRRRLATYEGLKKVLVIRLIDVNGLVNPDPPSVMSDKIFGTYGDRFTMTSQFHACSFGKLTITNDYGIDMSNVESAPGVVEVPMNVDITAVDLRSGVRNEFVRATEAKLGRSLPGVFDHVLFVLEACYVGCGWAGYATVNGWLSVYHKQHYKSMAVTLHEIG